MARTKLPDYNTQISEAKSQIKGMNLTKKLKTQFMKKIDDVKAGPHPWTPEDNKTTKGFVIPSQHGGPREEKFPCDTCSEYSDLCLEEAKTHLKTPNWDKMNDLCSWCIENKEYCESDISEKLRNIIGDAKSKEIGPGIETVVGGHGAVREQKKHHAHAISSRTRSRTGSRSRTSPRSRASSRSRTSPRSSSKKIQTAGKYRRKSRRRMTKKRTNKNR